MRQFNASHLEVKKDFTEDFQTHPYECGWASEVIFFIVVEDISGEGATLEAEAEISHDGVNWVSEGTAFETISGKGMHFIKVSHFGNWLRLNCRVSGKKPVFRLLIQIALKE